MIELKIQRQGLNFIVVCYKDEAFSHILGGSFSKVEAESMKEGYLNGTL